MNNKPWYVIVGTFLGILALFFAIGLFLYRVRAVLPPFIIAFAIAFLLDPLLERLQRRGLPRIAAVTTVFAIFMAVFVLSIIFLVPAVIDQAGELGKDYPSYAVGFKTTATEFLYNHHVLLQRLHLPSTLEEVFAQYGNNANNWFKAQIPALGTWIVGNLSVVPWIVLIPLIAFYFLNDFARIRRKAMIFIPNRYRTETAKVLARMGAVFSAYVRGLTVVCLTYGVIITIVLLSRHLKYGIILGMIAGILYAVPYLGPITTSLLVFLVGLATYPHGISQALLTTAFAFITNEAFDLIITPRILGKSVGIHPILSIFALLTGGQLFGLAGMILAVPIAASIQEVVFEFYPELRNDPDDGIAKPKFSLFGRLKRPANIRDE